MPDEGAKTQPFSEDPADIADQDRMTVEADTEIPPPVLVKRGWATSTFESLRHRDFALFWSGALVSNVGTWMQNAALAIVVWSFQPAHASLNTGIVQGVAGLPVLFLAYPQAPLPTASTGASCSSGSKWCCCSRRPPSASSMTRRCSAQGNRSSHCCLWRRSG